MRCCGQSEQFLSSLRSGGRSPERGVRVFETEACECGVYHVVGTKCCSMKMTVMTYIPPTRQLSAASVGLQSRDEEVLTEKDGPDAETHSWEHEHGGEA